MTSTGMANQAALERAVAKLKKIVRGLSQGGRGIRRMGVIHPFTPMHITFLRSLFIAASLLPALPLRAAEAFYLIDAGFITAVDTNTGATLSSWNDNTSNAGLGGMQFSNHDMFYIQTKNLNGERARRYTPTGPHTWARTGTISQGEGMRWGNGLALQRTGLMLAIGQNSHDLWHLQRIYPVSPPAPPAGRVRSYDPLRFPTHIAASPLDGRYATWFFNGTLQLTNGSTDEFTTGGYGGVEGLCFDYSGYPYTDPGTQITTARSLLYVSNGNGNTVRRYDAVTMQPYGKPSDRSNPVLVSAGTGGMIGIDRIAVDPETGTLFAMGRNQNYKDDFNTPDIVIAGFSTEDGTPRGLGGSTTDPVVYHRPSGNAIVAFCIRPAVQVQQYSGGTHTLGSLTFADPGKTLQLFATGPATVNLQPGATLSSVNIGGALSSLNAQFSELMRVVSSLGSILSMINAEIARAGSLTVSAASTVNITTGVTATDGGTLQVDAGGTLNCPSGDVTIGVNSRLRAAGLIAVRSLRAESGGVIAPGASLGTMSLQGSLDLLAGSTLEIEIAGTQAGVTHDLVNVQNATMASLNGRFVPQLAGGFTPQPSDTFTVISSNVAISGTIQNLSAGRVSTASGRGSFALKITSGGTAIQLSDYQTVPPEQAWRNVSFTPAQQADPLISGDAADPDSDGLNNFMEFALNADPLSGAAPPSLPSTGNGVSFIFSRYSGGTASGANYDYAGLRYVIESSTTLTGWGALAPDDPSVTSWTVTPNADGITETVRLTLSGTRRLLRLAVSR